jgi:hypothetical protein
MHALYIYGAIKFSRALMLYRGVGQAIFSCAVGQHISAMWSADENFYGSTIVSIDRDTQTVTVNWDDNVKGYVCHELSCGTAGGCGETAYCANDMETHEVGCCSSIEIAGWRAPTGSCLVWGERDLGGSCQYSATFGAAKTYCESIGGRLCTVAELEADCTYKTGCIFDDNLLWSSAVGVITIEGVPFLPCMKI